MQTLILVSASPRRQQLLRQMGINFIPAPSHIDEVYDRQDNPQEVALSLANQKLQAFLSGPAHTGYGWCLAADTLVSLDNIIYGKPHTQQQAQDFLQQLAGKTHKVYTGLAIYGLDSGETLTLVECSEVEFLPLSEAMINWYLQSGEWQDAAGAYKIQGRAQCLIKATRGSFSNIMGLPMHQVFKLLTQLGYNFSIS
jgi:septum formation protein